MWKELLKELILNVLTLGIRAIRKTLKNMKGDKEKNGNKNQNIES